MLCEDNKEDISEYSLELRFCTYPTDWGKKNIINPALLICCPDETALPSIPLPATP